MSKQRYRGKDLHGKDLASQDFSDCDLRGTNFAEANLKGANFIGVKAGLEPQQQLMVLTGLILLSTLFTLVLEIVGQRTGDRLLYKPPPGVSSTEIGLNYLAALVIIIILTASISSIHRGIKAAILVPFWAGLITTSLIIVHALIQLFGRIATNTSFDTAFSYAQRSVIQAITSGVTGYAFVVIVMAVATAFASAYILHGRTGRLIVSLILFLVVTLFSTATWLAGTHLVSIGVGWLVSMVSIMLGLNAAKEILNENSEFIFLRRIAVAVATVGGTNFQRADLTDADFTSALLHCTDFRAAFVTRTCWKNAKRLDQARLGDTILFDSQVRNLLVELAAEKGNFIGCNLKGANLVAAQLRNADFTEADISEATFDGADLREINLTRARAIGTDFYHTCMTGAILNDWSTDGSTMLAGVECDYIQKGERIPIDRNFEPGEFTQLFQKAINVVELIFRNGVEWISFAVELKKLHIKYGEAPLVVRDIKNRDGAVVVKVELPSDINRTEFHQEFMAGYSLAKQHIESTYVEMLKNTKQQVDRQDQYINQLFYALSELPKLMSELRPSQQNFFNSHISGGVSANDYIGDVIHNYGEEKQSLAEAAKEIQSLLKQLENSNPSATEAQKAGYVTTAISPTRRERFVSALNAGWQEAIKEFLDNTYANVAIAILEGWQNP